MKAAVLGSGLMGSVVAQDLARSEGVDSVTVADLDEEKLAQVKRESGGRRLALERLDVSDSARATEFLRRFDVAVSALPHGVVHASDLAAVSAGAKMVNVAFEDEQMALDAEARKTGALLVPGCGVAPGLGGILLAHGRRTLGGADEGHIMVGGLPQRPSPPFGYRLVFSVVGLIREYTDEARIFKGGRLVRVRPFSTIERVRFPEPVGTLEAFCTDGLASLVYTMRGMRTLDEKTLRWPGHAEKMALLQDAGYFSREKVTVGTFEVAPIELSWEVLRRKLGEGDPKDMTVMRVIIKSAGTSITYDMVDMYDEVRRVTSMGKTTGYTASIVAQMVGKGLIKGSGTVPPETAVSGRIVDLLLTELKRRGVSIRSRRTGR